MIFAPAAITFPVCFWETQAPRVETYQIIVRRGTAIVETDETIGRLSTDGLCGPKFSEDITCTVVSGKCDCIFWRVFADMKQCILWGHRALLCEGELTQSHTRNMRVIGCEVMEESRRPRIDLEENGIGSHTLILAIIMPCTQAIWFPLIAWLWAFYT